MDVPNKNRVTVNSVSHAVMMMKSVTVSKSGSQKHKINEIFLKYFS